MVTLSRMHLEEKAGERSESFSTASRAACVAATSSSILLLRRPTVVFLQIMSTYNRICIKLVNNVGNIHIKP